MGSEKIQEIFHRGHHQNLRRVWKKNSKPVIWNGIEFESGRALLRHLKIWETGGGKLSRCIKEGKPLHGHIPRRK